MMDTLTALFRPKDGAQMERTASETLRVVGVGEYRISRDRQDVLVTYSLGSCVGVAAYDPKAGVGGMLHFMLPDSRINPEKGRLQPAVFGDTGLTAFLGELFSLGATRKDLVIRLAGGARVLRDGEFFDIGRRNILMVKKILWKNSLPVLAEEMGGEVSRTIRLWMADGRAVVRDGAGERPFGPEL